MKLAPELLYDDDHIYVAYQAAESGTVAITFSNLYLHEEGRPESFPWFWGSNLVSAFKCAVLGVVSKSANWFPEDSIRAAANVLNRAAAGYDHCFTYGSSMGAYAAIKYADLVGAAFCLAFSPQYSIDRLDIVDERFAKYFSPSLNATMAVQGSRHARIYILCDLQHVVDRGHAQLIARHNEHVSIINVPWTDHDTINVFASGSAIRTLLTACSAGSHRQLREVSAGIRRANKLRDGNLARALIDRRPRVATKPLAVLSNISSSERSALFERLAERLANLGEVELAAEALGRAATQASSV